MKKIICISLALLLGLSSAIAAANVSVDGYTKKNGTYVAPHQRTSPDSSFHNNWSTKGNSNPYTGKKGYKKYKGY